MDAESTHKTMDKQHIRVYVPPFQLHKNGVPPRPKKSVTDAILKYTIHLQNLNTQSFYYVIKTCPTVTFVIHNSVC